MVQTTRVSEIEEVWLLSGARPCAHEKTDLEFYRESPTGDVVCLTCGDAWPQDADKPPARGTGA